MRVSPAELIDEIDKALEIVNRSRGENWASFTGLPLDAQLDSVAQELLTMRDRVLRGLAIERQTAVNNLLRFVADWIPDTSHPLLGQLAKVTNMMV